MSSFKKVTSAIQWAAILACCSATASHAATYYVDASKGIDTNLGTSTSAAWKTLSKVNASASSGDTVLLQGGGTWEDSLTVKSNVTYGTYGSSAKAIISGSRSVNGLSWARDGAGSNVWVATTTAAVESGEITQVFIDGMAMTRARTPNVGKGDYGVANSRYAKITQNGNDTTLNIAAGVVPAGQSVEGATAFVRNIGYDRNEFLVNSASGAGQGLALNLSHVSILDDWGIYNQFPLNKDFGYWLENKRWMLDTPGEWFFDTSNHKLYIWLPDSTSPVGTTKKIAVASKPGIVGDTVSNVKITNISVQGTVKDAISFNHVSNITLDNLSITRAGRRGIAMADSKNSTVSNSVIDNTRKEGVWLGHVSTTYSPISPLSRRSVNITLNKNQITNTGLSGAPSAAVLMGEGGDFTNNLVTNASGTGVLVATNSRVENNQILNTCVNFDDCGGIYVGQPPVDSAKLATATPTTPITRVMQSNNVTIVNNIVDTGTGSPDGVPGGGTDTRGIYLDDYTNGVTVSRNYVSGMNFGYTLHNASNNTLSDNLAINNRAQNLFLQEGTVPAAVAGADGTTAQLKGGMTGNVITHNAWVANKDASKPTLAIPNILQTAEGGSGPTGKLASYDLNRYTSLNPNATDVLAYNYGSDVAVADATFAAWQQVLKNDPQGVFFPYSSTGEAWGFYNPSTATASKVVACIKGSATPCGPFYNLLKDRTTKINLPALLPVGTSVILVK
jgi:parallel beta-helix repeat protein